MEEQKVNINTGVDTNFFLDILGRDISTQACIYDLIDNSIDAAKRHKNQNDNYSGYEILISVQDDKLTVTDNCGGFSEDELTSRAFVTGRQSNHHLGLGKYGVGMKRAIAKIGKRFNLSTDNGNSSYKLTATVDQLSSSSSTIEARLETSSNIETKIEIFELEHDVVCEFRDSSWNAQLLNEIGTRYSLFLNQGLSIKISPIEGGAKKKATSMLPELRSSSDVPLVKETKTINDVNVSITAGLHKQYVITSKQGVNRKLTADFGWYIICNERVIAAAIKQGDEYGWTNKAWHSEYGGFVGFVYLTSEEPDKLPWNTAKTQVLTNHMIMVGLRPDLSRISLNYKALRKKASKEDENTAQSSNASSNSNGNSNQSNANESEGSGNDNNSSNSSNNQTETEPLKSLAQVLGIKKNVGAKALMAFQEYQFTKQISSDQQGLKIARAALIRVLIETSLKFHAQRLGVYDENEEDKKNHQTPAMGRIIKAVKTTVESRKENINNFSNLITSIKSLSNLVKDLNNMMHKDGVFIVDGSESGALESIKFIIEELCKIPNPRKR